MRNVARLKNRNLAAYREEKHEKALFWEKLELEYLQQNDD